MPISIGNQTLNSGDRIICYIQGALISNAHVHVNDSRSGWVCHDNSRFEGDRCSNRHGHRYSWSFGVRSDGTFTTEVSNIFKVVSEVVPKDNVTIDPELIRFFESSLLIQIPLVLQFKLGVFDDYNQYKMSSEPGMIHVSSTLHKKKIDIKFGRFIRQLIIEANKINFIKFEQSDRFIEELANKYTSHQTGGTLKMELVSGEKLLDAYRMKNYAPGCSTLHKSCMTDHTDWLKLYSENPNQVELAVVYFEDKIAARALVWTLTDGRKFIDRTYYVNDWLDEYLTKRVDQELGIKKISKARLATVQLDKWAFDKYPYLDTFYSMDKEIGQLYHLGLEGTIHLRHTNGGPN